MDEKWIDASISSLLRRISPTRNVILVNEKLYSKTSHFLIQMSKNYRRN